MKCLTVGRERTLAVPDSGMAAELNTSSMLSEKQRYVIYLVNRVTSSLCGACSVTAQDHVTTKTAEQQVHKHRDVFMTSQRSVSGSSYHTFLKSQK